MTVNEDEKTWQIKERSHQRGQEKHQRVAPLPESLLSSETILSQKYWTTPRDLHHGTCFSSGAAHCVVIAARQQSMNTPCYFTIETAKRHTVSAPRIAQVKAVLPVIITAVQEQLDDHIPLSVIERHATSQSVKYILPAISATNHILHDPVAALASSTQATHLPDCSRHPSSYALSISLLDS